MFNSRRELLLSKSFFHEATNYIQKTFSTTTIHSLQFDNDNNPPEDKGLLTIIYMFFKLFFKMYVIRIGFMAISLTNKKSIKLGILNIIYNATFNFKNLRTSLFVAIIPFLYNIQHIIAKHFLNINTNTFIFTFLSGFVASYIGISYENVTDLVRFIILSMLGRFIHSLFTIIALKYKYSHQNKVVSFLIAFSVFSAFNIFNYYIPEFRPISNLVDKYGLYRNNDKQEMNYIRSIKNIFK